jgi:hypothetical protein
VVNNHGTSLVVVNLYKDHATMDWTASKELGLTRIESYNMFNVSGSLKPNDLTSIGGSPDTEAVVQQLCEHAKDVVYASTVDCGMLNTTVLLIVEFVEGRSLFRQEYTLLFKWQ